MSVQVRRRDYELTFADEGESEVLDNLAANRLEDPELFLLNQRAARLSLVQGFDQLLSLDAISVTPFAYQLETAHRTLQRFRGRALLAD